MSRENHLFKDSHQSVKEIECNW